MKRVDRLTGCMYELIAHATSSRTRDTCSRLIISSFGAAARCTVLAGWQQSCCRIGVGEAGCGRSIRAACACVWVRAPPRRLFHPRADHGTPLRTPRRCGSSHHLLHLCRVLWQLYSLWQQSLKRIRRAHQPCSHPQVYRSRGRKQLRRVIAPSAAAAAA